MCGHLYNISIRIDPELRRVRGEQWTTYHNYSNATLRDVMFTLDFNLARFEGYSMSVEAVMDNRGRELEFENPSINGKIDKSLLLVKLKEKLKPEEKARLKIEYRGNLGCSPSETGEDVLNLNDSFYGFSPSYYPRLLNFRRGEWQMGNYRDYISASYKIELTLPEEQVLASSGKVLEEENLGGGLTRVSLEAENVRGFGLVMSPRFGVHADSLQDIVVNSYYLPKGEERAEKLLGHAKDVLSFYVSDVGFYPWKNLAILPGSYTSTGGYASTNMIFIHRPEPSEDFLRRITAHEIAHQYWGAYVGDPNDYPKWFSIGMTLWLDERYTRSRDPSHRPKTYRNYLTGLFMDVDTTIMQKREKLEKAKFDWNNIIQHSKAYTVIKMLEDQVGRAVFKEIVMELLRRYSGRIINANEFRELCEQLSGEDLDWFFSQWLYTNKKLDYRVVNVVESEESGWNCLKVKVKRFGDARMPIPVRVVFQSGQEETKVMGRDLDDATLTFLGDSPMKSAVLDSDELLPLMGRIKELEPHRLGYALFNSGRYREAAQKLREALRKNPKDSVANFVLGLCLYDGEDYDSSAKAFREVLRLIASDEEDPKLAWSHIWIGHILDIGGKHDEAKEEYERAIATGNTVPMRFDQYGIKSDAVTWAKKRFENPFTRK